VKGVGYNNCMSRDIEVVRNTQGVLWCSCAYCGRHIMQIQENTICHGVSIKCKGTSKIRCGKILKIELNGGLEPVACE